MGRGNNYARPTVALCVDDHRIVNLAKTSQNSRDEFVIERLEGMDAMGEGRWLRCAAVEPHVAWLLEQAGRLAEKDSER